MFDNEDNASEPPEVQMPPIKLTMFTADQRLEMNCRSWDAQADHLMAFSKQANVWPDEGRFSITIAPTADLLIVARGLRKWATLLEGDAVAISQLIASGNSSLRSRADGSLEEFDASREVYEQLYA